SSARDDDGDRALRSHRKPPSGRGLPDVRPAGYGLTPRWVSGNRRVVTNYPSFCGWPSYCRGMPPEITRIETSEFGYTLDDVGSDPGFNLVYDPDETTERRLFSIRVFTDSDLTGEFVGGNSPGFAEFHEVADYLIGKNPLRRERHWSEMKRGLRKYDRMGISPVDI